MCTHMIYGHREQSPPKYGSLSFQISSVLENRVYFITHCSWPSYIMSSIDPHVTRLLNNKIVVNSDRIFNVTDNGRHVFKICRLRLSGERNVRIIIIEKKKKTKLRQPYVFIFSMAE